MSNRDKALEYLKNKLPDFEKVKLDGNGIVLDYDYNERWGCEDYGVIRCKDEEVRILIGDISSARLKEVLKIIDNMKKEV